MNELHTHSIVCAGVYGGDSAGPGGTRRVQRRSRLVELLISNTASHLSFTVNIRIDSDIVM